MTVRAREGEDEDYDKRWVCKVGRSGAPELLRSCGGVCECVVRWLKSINRGGVLR